MKILTPHIVQYQGSKRLLAPQILKFLPMKFERFVEPFSGMAAMTIAVSHQKRANSYVLNDVNEPLMRILKEVVMSPDKLLREYSEIWNNQFSFPQGSVAHFYRVRKEFNEGDKRAANMLYLIARCVKGSVRYNSEGMFNQSPDKRRYGTSPKKLAANIYDISYYLKDKTSFYSLDYREILHDVCVGDIVYMDPPYQGVSNVRDCRYVNGINLNDFINVIDKLNERNIDFLISFDGKCGNKEYGEDLPTELGLRKVMLKAGLSSQSLLLGKREVTYEALYISKGLQPFCPKEVMELPIFKAI